MAPILPPSFHATDLIFNGHIYYTPAAFAHPLLSASRHAPQNIDTHLRPYLSSGTLPPGLSHLIRAYVSTLTTPGLYGTGIRSRPRWFYANCAVFGMLLGRAFALLSTPIRPPKTLYDASEFPFTKLPMELRLQIYEYYKEDLAIRQQWWDAITEVFIKALWSGHDTEEGARYVTGIIMLTSGHSMSLAAPLLRGHGTGYVWWNDSIKEPEQTWTFADLHKALLATSSLSRKHTNISEAYNYESHESMTWLQEYVSAEVLEVYDLAREHIQADERDWTPPEIAARLMSGLFESTEARAIWEETGLVPRMYERKFAEEKKVADGFSLTQGPSSMS